MAPSGVQWKRSLTRCSTKMSRKSKYQHDLLRVRYRQTQEHWSAACTTPAFQGDKTKATCHLLHSTVYTQACTFESMHLHVMPQQYRGRKKHYDFRSTNLWLWQCPALQPCFGLQKARVLCSATAELVVQLTPTIRHLRKGMLQQLVASIRDLKRLLSHSTR